ncbi:hypothetical protein BDZ94DRAFT_1282617 [Collybia nuda]|uniref:Uncharacterized protein n=1 Tax=Collybia nuda TaxID=64659 RepID=A0A9P5Y8U1_9AGAR|nr:hypothetical protein BDZ94DRAFT_1282617 [Collybia nuda]
MSADRSQSRGREAFHSSGRGGIGNIRQASASRDARPGGPDDFSTSRGREPVPASTFSTGRGGAGNIRSPSRDINNPLSPDSAKGEQDIIRDHVAANQDAPHSTGRGGVGNITNRSRSRGPSAPAITQVHSTGRGGAGNIIMGDALISEIIDEEERKQYAHPDDAWHSTGRGGLANISVNPPPAVERRTHTRGEYESTGRGGAGNIIRDRSASRPRS